MAKEVAKKDKAEVPAVMDFEQDAGQGFEDLTADDMQTPFLVLLQKGSPQVDEDNDSAPTLDGAKAGMFLNSVTNELFDEADVICVAYRRAFTNWAKREDGGGFLGEISVDDPVIHEAVRDEKNRDILPDGTQIADTRTFYILHVKSDGDLVPMILALTSTQIKKARRWLTVMSTLKVSGKTGQFNPPIYSQIYNIKSTSESNAKGNWKGLDITHAGAVTTPEQYEAAKRFRKLVSEGAVKAAQPVEGDDVPF